MFLSKFKVPREAVRGIQGFFSLAVLILSAYVANWYNTDTLTSSPSQINVLLAAAAISIVSIIHLEVTSKFFPRLASPFVSIAVEFINLVFWFGSSISLAVFLSRLLFCRGSVCAAAQADAVFAFVNLLAWLGTFVPLTLDLFKGGLRKPTGPSMSGGAGMKEVA
ncbi:membrane-associating domain-containing protein [Echria macrotheca]|uniref:Membrane-associating domain-containing protein n=1 Tax=Echria macrotheca TaxID=438768 RepID=A0AAJ0BD50_9PEZI|nr:membrane-associating domain-containing protein [Echria macrotheca]